MTKIQYLELFQKDLQEIYNYIHDTIKNKTAADNFVNAVEEAIINRSLFPLSTEPYKSKKKREYTYYRIYVDNYIVFYIVIEGDPSIMEVHRIIYMGRDISGIL